MFSSELSDLDGDALTLITTAHGTWITCTSGPDEVTVGPLPVHGLRQALTPGSQGDSRASERFIRADRPPRTAETPTDDARERAWDAFLSTVRTGTLREALDSALDAALSASEKPDRKAGQPVREPERRLHLLAPTDGPLTDQGGAPADQLASPAPRREG